MRPARYFRGAKGDIQVPPASQLALQRLASDHRLHFLGDPQIDPLGVGGVVGLGGRGVPIGHRQLVLVVPQVLEADLRPKLDAVDRGADRPANGFLVEHRAQGVRQPADLFDRHRGGTSPSLATRYLTDYSVMHAELTFTRWQALVEHLITKYNDGYVRDERLGKSTEVGYSEAWLRRVVREQPDRYQLPVEKPGEAPTH